MSPLLAFFPPYSSSVYIVFYKCTFIHHRTAYPRAPSLISSSSRAYLSLPFAHLPTLCSFVLTYSPERKNALHHETLNRILPHSCLRCRSTSTSCERLVRSMHSRQMLLGSARRIWFLGVGEHCQSVLYLCQARHFSGPFADMIYLRIHSGVLPLRFRTLLLLLVGKLRRNATRLTQSKILTLCARTTIQTVITSFKVTAQ
jgi:hypothetical protein